ncbi:hypothetical protein CHELA41_22038 [Hyphomicrobiales bacterium]|nr:hypothetical protein CHELA41_22038 [Hyphomicrobiales bacterium]
MERLVVGRRSFMDMTALAGGFAVVVASSPFSGSDRLDSFSSVVARVMKPALLF